MKRGIIILCGVITMMTGCKENVEQTLTGNTGLQLYIDANAVLEQDDLIACAGGNSVSFVGDSVNPVSVFFYPEEGAYEFRYYETDSLISDPSDYTQYEWKAYHLTDLFNGTMKKFDHPKIENERWGIVTYKTPGKFHMCNPIRLKAAVHPTMAISDLVDITVNGTSPTFNWSMEDEPNNVIYFSIVSSLQNELISGTYTYDKYWTFYDLSNVVLNVTPTENPELESEVEYGYTLMGVSEDNWVHTFASKSFHTN